jgi:hypothetical protein
MKTNDNLEARMDEARLVSFARSYLGASFPNPERIGCPPLEMLRRLAEQPTSANLSITEHLGGCSPCFQQYQELLAKTRTGLKAEHARPHRLRLVFAGIAGAVLVLFLFVWYIVRPLDSRLPKEAVLDLRDGFISRGADRSPADALLRLRRVTNRVLIYLPIGAEGSYRLDVLDDTNTLIATTAGSTETEGSLILLSVPLNLSRERPGVYVFELRRPTGFVRVYKVRLE